ncbi:hypothetical protein BJY01DRAFT_211219 [Aspergillus pseudoustus]|uniref:Fungal-specific transcription factor domain-containing protein n=1 Tax=Aspergillus pseudoustus TaxID=1810923 RepID=A0ABR4KA26_9EURO
MSTDLASKPYKCNHCTRSFTRVEHLKRHIALHTGIKPYSCKCGQAFSRSDVLSRHKRRCGKALPNSDVAVPEISTNRVRLRKVCGHCARLKTKCDRQQPCQTCKRSGTICTYETNQSPRHSGIAPSSGQGRGRNLSSAEQDLELTETNDAPDHREASIAMFDPDLLDFGHDLWTFNWTPGGHQNLESPNFPSCSVPNSFRDDEVVLDVSSADSSNPICGKPVPNCFHLQQIDPLACKLEEIRALVDRTGWNLAGFELEACLTRENLTRGLASCGQHFQRHFPIIHSGTFSLLDCPAHLLLGMFCVGASYDKSIAEPRQTLKLAMIVLSDIENQSHEKNMTQPPLSTLQASLCASIVLATSQDESAWKFVTIQMMRNISMAERAGILKVEEPPEYHMQDENTFSWNDWIDRETRTRIANAIFNQNVSWCIFRGSSSHLSPFHVNFSLPCYEVCWEARTAKGCLQHLQSTPRPIQLSAALEHLRQRSSSQSPFEPSAGAMFTLIHSLHFMVWVAIQSDLKTRPELRQSGRLQMLPQNDGDEDLATEILKNFSSPYIASLANDAVSYYGHSALQDINEVLDKWLLAWEERRYIIRGGPESAGFGMDPMPFWCLAKLYLLLHCRSQEIKADSEFSYFLSQGVEMEDKMKLQAQVYKWMSKLRCSQYGKTEDRKGSIRGLGSVCLAELMNPIPDTSP